MFGFGRRKTRGELVKTELGESIGHFRQAAAHAATGVGAAVAPRVIAARGYVSPAAARLRNTASDGWESTMTTFAPLAAAAVGGVRHAGAIARNARSQEMGDMKAMRMRGMPARRIMMMRGQRPSGRWRRLAGMVAAGAAVGAMSAMAMRRRRRQQWEEYDPSRAAMTREGAESMMGAAREAMRTTPGSTAPESPSDLAKMRASGATGGNR